MKSQGAEEGQWLLMSITTFSLSEGACFMLSSTGADVDNEQMNILHGHTEKARTM